MTDIDSKSRRPFIEDILRQRFEQTLNDRVSRALALPQQPIIPAHHFASASTQCVYLWRDGYFLAVVMMTQAIIEGICRFIHQKHDLPTCGKPPEAAQLLSDRGLISPSCAKAITQIWCSFRNDVHHMNPKVADVEKDFTSLAKRNIDALKIVESEIFAFDVVDLKIRPKNPLYWDVRDDGTVPVYVRCD